MSLLGNDTCRCISNRCKERESCLRSTDVPEGERLPFSNFYKSVEKVCPYKITEETWNAS